MLNRRDPRRPRERRGVILMVVLCLLTLFAIIGIAFVFYADAEATSARVAREAETLGANGSIVWNSSGTGGGGNGGSSIADLDPYTALSIALGQIIYDTSDTNPASGGGGGGGGGSGGGSGIGGGGISSALRGLSLGRHIYGYNSSQPYPNDKAYIGSGRPHFPSFFSTQTPAGTMAADDAFFMNYTYFAGDKFLRDPERFSWRADPTAPLTPYTGGFNVPYTYPDHQNFYLGLMRAADGRILMPSFHRPWLFGDLGDQNNPNWTNNWGKYLTPRYRPQEMGPGFPYPVDSGGDVKNLDWAIGFNGQPTGMDSIWIDPGAPIMTTSTGLQYKMLIAPLILDLGSRLDLNAHGNILLPGNGHAGNQGGVPTEVNLTQVFAATVGNANEVPNLFVGANGVKGRYGPNGVPEAYDPKGNLLPPYTGPSPHLYAATDFNGTLDPAPQASTGPIQFPGQGTYASYNPFPFFPNGYGNGANNELFNANNPPQLIHPLTYSPQFPMGDDRAFPISSMVALLRSSGQTGYTPPGGALPPSDLLSLCPNSFTNLKLRNLCGVFNSFALDRPALTPYIWDPNDSTSSPTTRYIYAPTIPGNNTALLSPTLTGEAPIPYPPLNLRAGNVPANSDYDFATWRGIPKATRLGSIVAGGPGPQALLGRIDLNRFLTPYPPPYPSGGRFDTTNNSVVTQVNQAVADRQQFALDLFNALIVATGALDPITLRQTYPNYATNGSADQQNYTPMYNALYWLAQLAVNMVDYIDQDDYNTPFNWDPGATTPQWVYGTELPRLVINEVYVQLDNDPADPGVSAATPKATTAYNVNVTAELVNPTPSEASYNNTAILQDTAGNIYQILLADSGPAPINQNMRALANTTGDPDFGLTTGTNVLSKVNNFGTTAVQQTVLPVNGAYSGPDGSKPNGNSGFYVIAPPSGNYFTDPTSKQSTAPTNIPTPNATPSDAASPVGGPPKNCMSYQIPLTNTTPKPTVILQRLTCPGLPANPVVNGVPQNKNLPPNPYITVDYVEMGLINNSFFDARKYDGGGNTPTLGTGPQASYGRSQPYAASANQILQQTPQGFTAGANLVAHTFFRHNAIENTAPPSASTNGQTLRVPFDWLVHLDRQPTSPIDLWHVSFYKPHELTQQFYSGQGSATFSPTTPAICGQMTPWLDQTNRLYRVFEMLETSSRASFVNYQGRIPGKINLNNIWDLEIGRALCDPQPGDLFTQAQVDAVITAMIQQRSPTTAPNLPNNSPGGQMPGIPFSFGTTTGDQPFWSLGMGPAVGNDPLDPASVTPAVSNPAPAPMPRGINNTILRANPGGGTSMLFDPYPTSTPVPPYQRMQILSKLFNNATTTSNVFAVWITVGFFQVTDSTTTPVKLGAEVTSNGQKIRHQMFCIVDRSHLQTFSTTSPNAVTASPVPQFVALNWSQSTVGPPASFFVTDGRTGRSWQVTQDTLLVYEPNTANEETVSVQRDPTTGNISAVFLRNHPPGCVVINRGNPGPMSAFDPASDSLVVPYYVIIK